MNKFVLLIKYIIKKMDKKTNQGFITKNNVGQILAKQGINNVKLNRKDLADMCITHVDDFHKIINQQIPLSMDPEAKVNNAHKIAAWLKVSVDELAEEISENLTSNDPPEEKPGIPVNFSFYTKPTIRKNRLAEIWKKNNYHQLNLVPSSYKNMGVANKEEFDKLLNNEAEFSDIDRASKMANWLGVGVDELIDENDYKA